MRPETLVRPALRHPIRTDVLQEIQSAESPQRVRNDLTDSIVRRHGRVRLWIVRDVRAGTRIVLPAKVAVLRVST